MPRDRNRDTGNTDPFAVGGGAMTLEQADALGMGAPPITKTKSLQFKEDNIITFRRFRLTRTGFVPPEDAKPDDWRELGDMLFRLDGSLQWMIGDFLEHQTGWGEISKIAQEFGYEVSTFYDYKKVARAVKFEVRTSELTFGHHKIVASLDEKSQREWLQKAVDNAWSIAEMRRQLASARKNALVDNTLGSSFESEAQKWQRRIAQAGPEDLQRIVRASQAILERARQRLHEIS